MKVSIPKLHSYKLKNSGITSEDVEVHPDKFSHIDDLSDAIVAAINGHATNMSNSELVGVLEFIKNDILNP